MNSQQPPQSQPPVYYQPQPPVVIVQGKTNTYATMSLIFSILWLFWLGSLLGLLFGCFALDQIKKSGNAEGGKAMAWIGIAISTFSLLPFILMLYAAAGSSAGS